MQSRLAEGYTRYAENITTVGNTVWIAPVGLAFKTVHDAVEANGTNATQAGNLFYDLYTADGSHPSLKGSYLAACVMFSTLSGDSCSGSNDSVSLSASVKLELQQAADDTVFNQTAGMSYYPWEVSGASAFGMGSSIPNGWYLQWVDDEISNLAAGSSQTVTLDLSVPSNAVPDYYGFKLTIGSTNGNMTTSTILVVHVEAENELSMSFTSQNDLFLPGQTTLTEVNVTNIGNGVVDLNWVAGLSAGGLCQVALPSPQNLGVQPGGVVSVPIAVTISEQANASHICAITLGVDSLNEQIIPGGLLFFSVNVDELVNFSLTGPSTNVDLVPGDGVNYEVRINNTGSEDVTFFLDPIQHPNLTTSLVSSSGVAVAAGEVGIWTVNTNGPTGLFGILEQEFSVTYGGMNASLGVDINAVPVRDITVVGPTDGRIIITPGQNSIIPIEVINSGTADLELTASILGLPSSVSGQLSDSTVTLLRNETATVNLSITASLSANPSSTALTIAFGQGATERSLSLDLIIEDRLEVMINSAQNEIDAHPQGDSNLTLQVTNLGTSADTYVIELSSTATNLWFTFSLSDLTLTLTPGETKTVTLSALETASGAPISGMNVTVSVSSTSTGALGDTFAVIVRPVVASAEIGLLGDVASAKPGDSVYGSIILTNTGSGTDTFAVDSVGVDCGLSTSVTLAPGLSSEALPWVCVVANDAPAGQKSVTFRAVSSMRSNVVIEQSVGYQVEPDWPDNTLVAVLLEDGKISLGIDSSSTTIVTLKNMGNVMVTGKLDATGTDTGLLRLEWMRVSDGEMTNEYTLTPGSSMDFKLTLTSNVARSSSASIVVQATSTGSGVLTTDESVGLNVDIKGPELPPNGLALPLGLSVSQPAALGTMGLGWLIAVIAIMLLRRSRPDNDADSSDDGDQEEEDEEEEKEESELGYNECRLDDDNKVICPECDAKLGVPRGSEPPFRFTCPKCDNKIRVIG